MTDSPSVSAPLFVGIDVAKDELDLARSDTGPVATFPNDPAGIAVLLRSLHPATPALIVVEATGGLERPVLDALLDAGLPVALVNPGRVRKFAEGIGVLAKTDAIDARVLVEFARLASPRLAEKRSKTRVELDALVTCRRQLAGVRADQVNRRSRTTAKPALKALDAVIKTLGRQIEDLEKRIRRLVESDDDDLGPMDRILRSAPGVGAVLSTTLLAELAELGAVGRGTIGALTGVAPFNHDSGKTAGRRSIRGGRGAVRSVLYMATVACLHCNPVIKAFADRLRKAGKPFKVMIVACMRKLLSLLNVMVRQNLTWGELQVVKNLTKTA